MTNRTTITGHRGLDHEEPLIFELGSPENCGVDLPEPAAVESRLGAAERTTPVGLPGLSEPRVIRHYHRLSRQNYSIDGGFYPLGSCTMKYNPRLNEKVARLPGLGDIHPLQPEETVQGALELMHTCAQWLIALTGMPGITLSPGAGAQGELVGLMTIRTALEDRGNARKYVLVPESAHGTNPASAHACGYEVRSIPDDGRGRVDLEAFKAALDRDVAALMLTNPNTCGLFENDIVRIADALHAAGAFFYCDGANFNALVGRVRPGDLGVDTMHLNLHKTFSTPHGGGGPGSGPVVFSEALAPYAPLPAVIRENGRFRLIEHARDSADKPFGRVKGFHGQFGMFVRALSYMMSLGSDGLRQVSSDAVLNANYLLARLSDILHLPFEGPCMHEVLFDDRSLRETAVTTLDLAKALLDEGFHPMTIYFPLVVHGAMLMEPTETEGKRTLDSFIEAIRGLVRQARAGEGDILKNAPYLTPRRRLDETGAARRPILRWRPEQADAAE
jgi:glycine dehydrogenase subunit 2